MLGVDDASDPEIQSPPAGHGAGAALRPGAQRRSGADPEKQADTEVKDTRERLLGDRRAELEHYVQIAMGSIQAEYDRSANGDLNARAEAIARLSKVKYGKDGYIFGYDSQVVRLFRGDSPVDVGKSFRDRRDPSGVYLNRELVEAGKNGSHYVTYTSPLPGNESVMVPKLSYTLYLPKWDMVIGSAINLDGVEAQLVEIKQAIDERIGTLIASIVAIAGSLLVVLLVIGLAVANAMLRPLHQIRQNLDDIAAGEGDLTRRLPVTSHDELGELAGSFNRFVEKIHGLVRQIAGMTGDLKQLVEQMSAQAERSEQAMERQRHETDQVATAINEMSAAAHEVAQSAQRAAEAAQQTDHEGQAAKRVVDGSIERIHALVDEIRDSGSSLDSLQQDVQSIVSVLGVIRSIAEQTNLLALNAAIEGPCRRGRTWLRGGRRRSAGAGQPHPAEHPGNPGHDRSPAAGHQRRGRRHAPFRRGRRGHQQPGQPGRRFAGRHRPVDCHHQRDERADRQRRRGTDRGGRGDQPQRAPDRRRGGQRRRRGPAGRADRPQPGATGPGLGPAGRSVPHLTLPRATAAGKEPAGSGAPQSLPVIIRRSRPAVVNDPPPPAD